MYKNLSDKELLGGAGGQSEFSALYERYWEPLYAKAYHRLGNSEDAQDAVQEVFISLWRNRDAIDVEDTLAPYLFTAIKYQVIKRVLQKAKRGIQIPLAVEHLEHMNIDAEDLLQYKELRSAINDEVNDLPDRMKEIYCLSRMDNLKISEIAARLNISEQTVKNTLSTALGRLRQRLSRYSWLLVFFL